MKIYIVIEVELIEGGERCESIVGAWDRECLALEYAESQNGGRYMNWRVEEVQYNNAISPPKFPLSSIEIDADLREKCGLCGSSLKRKWFSKVIGCYQPECTNYWQTSI